MMVHAASLRYFVWLGGWMCVVSQLGRMQTHCFEKSLVATVIEDNVNPIDKVEKTSLVMAAAIQGVAPTSVVTPAVRVRIQAMLE